jgi:hypothetical protein
MATPAGMNYPRAMDIKLAIALFLVLGGGPPFGGPTPLHAISWLGRQCLGLRTTPTAPLRA